jgi:hypothetical protein
VFGTEIARDWPPNVMDKSCGSGKLLMTPRVGRPNSDVLENRNRTIRSLHASQGPDRTAHAVTAVIEKRRHGAHQNRTHRWAIPRGGRWEAVRVESVQF